MPPEIDSLNADSLKGLVLSLLAKIDDLVEQNKTLLARIDELLARIAELEGRAGKPPKTPANSSLPPSSGRKANVAAATTKKGRKGHPGVTRELCANPDVTGQNCIFSAFCRARTRWFYRRESLVVRGDGAFSWVGPPAPRTLQEASLTTSVAGCPTIGCLTGNDLTYRTTSSSSTTLGTMG